MSGIAGELGKNIIQYNEQYKENNEIDDSEEFDLETNDTSSENDIEQNNISVQTTQRIIPNNDQNIIHDNCIGKQNVMEEKCVTVKPCIDVKPILKKTPITTVKNNQNNVIVGDRQPRTVHFDETANVINSSPVHNNIKRNINPVQIVTISQSLLDKFSISKSTIIFLIVMTLIGVCMTIYRKFILHQ